ncbi:DUF3472 domain-containing protein [Christiangramia fulva]|uniref:DUF3472 domain-containing protein n=1 Tax=Christiangramia fulva TaxID=2126553 RepID=UPI003C2FFA1C
MACKPDTIYDSGDRSKSPEISLSVRIPAGGNSWVVNDLERNQFLITNSGIHNWTNTKDVIRIYFYSEVATKVRMGLNIKVPSGTSVIRLGLDGSMNDYEFNNESYRDMYVDEFYLDKPGYHYFEFQGVSKTGTYIADINEVLLGGSISDEDIHFVAKEENFYFGRRGPSVHLTYEQPEGKDVIFFYNELTVPEGKDKIGSYFMANGFAEGYFGMQVNSSQERRILFSVWSPYQTDDPDNVPDDARVQLLSKGENVITGRFGNEGSGGQSYLVYGWKPNLTYQFLLKGTPNNDNSTTYSAYFKNIQEEDWKFIAAFRRPQINSYLTRLHSFLENFNPDTGNLTREVLLGNQWIFDTNGNWTELSKAKFTTDDTGRSNIRLDFKGGVEGKRFFLKNTGFFTGYTEIEKDFSRGLNNKNPGIDLSKFEN